MDVFAISGLGLAAASFSMIFVLLAMGMGLAMGCYIAVKVIERRYSELFFVADAVYFVSRESERPKDATPCEASRHPAMSSLLDSAVN
jgi:hypothetical protein